MAIPAVRVLRLLTDSTGHSKSDQNPQYSKDTSAHVPIVAHSGWTPDKYHLDALVIARSNIEVRRSLSSYVRSHSSPALRLPVVCTAKIDAEETLWPVECASRKWFRPNDRVKTKAGEQIGVQIWLLHVHADQLFQKIMLLHGSMLSLESPLQKLQVAPR